MGVGLASPIGLWFAKDGLSAVLFYCGKLCLRWPPNPTHRGLRVGQEVWSQYDAIGFGQWSVSGAIW
jgi:hypothetical protein